MTLGSTLAPKGALLLTPYQLFHDYPTHPLRTLLFLINNKFGTRSSSTMGIKTFLRKLIKHTTPSSRKGASTLPANLSSPVTCSISVDAEETPSYSVSATYSTEDISKQSSTIPNDLESLDDALSTLAFVKKLPLQELSRIGCELDFSNLIPKHVEREDSSPTTKSSYLSLRSTTSSPLPEPPCAGASYSPSPASVSRYQHSSSTFSSTSIIECTPPTSPLLGNSFPGWKQIREVDISSVISYDVELTPLLHPTMTVPSACSITSSAYTLVDSPQDEGQHDTELETPAPTEPASSPNTRDEFIKNVRLPYLYNIALSAMTNNDPEAQTLLSELSSEIDCPSPEYGHAHCSCKLRTLASHKFYTRGITELEKRIIKRGSHLMHLQSLAQDGKIEENDVEIVKRQYFPSPNPDPESSTQSALKDSTFRSHLAKLVYYSHISHALRNRLINLQPVFDEPVTPDIEGVHLCPRVEYLGAGPAPVRDVDIAYAGEEESWEPMGEDEFWMLEEYESSEEGMGKEREGCRRKKEEVGVREERLRSFESDPEIF
ncbi:hypothetical protein BDV96DRAFT_639648 [Lophiotrema nucula]|uniref:Uncharacterized protein n=1 Tax=Lophiotrema nucula TaxID=690887 RepID=A0A6A5ZTR5_9PLEO|nr:hypothetical protein BDV96DRAFT_639648 [Lophiotrema nucula]